MYYYTKSDIERAQNRETKKLIDYKNNTNYIEHFKMMFKKETIKMCLTKENYIQNYKVPINEVTKRIISEWDNNTNINENWKRFDKEKRLTDFAIRRNCYPSWVKYDYIDNCLIYNQEYIKRMTLQIMENFKLNMEYFEKLDEEDFNVRLDKILKLKKNSGLKEVKDLKEFMGTKGIYMLVLDKYKQIYVGQSKRDVVERILRHWKRKIEFEDLLIGKTNETKISIDSFGLLDTTRIFIEDINPSYYNNSIKIDKREEYLVEAIPEKYLINKIGGAIRFGDIGSLEKIIETYKKRDLKK
ncbi:MAG: hypothetical protein J6A89_04430 [Clostridia bacterium]|nr:hypothetical protein [Clostridia bacterium]